MKWLLDWFLDGFCGPTDYSVIIEDGFYFPVQTVLVWQEGDTVVESDLRRGAALRMARRLRRQAEDQPQAVL